MRAPFTISAPPSSWVDRLPDGDYTVGRGADPRGTRGRRSGDTAARPKNHEAKRVRPRSRTSRTVSTSGK